MPARAAYSSVAAACVSVPETVIAVEIDAGARVDTRAVEHDREVGRLSVAGQGIGSWIERRARIAA